MAQMKARPTHAKVTYWLWYAIWRTGWLAVGFSVGILVAGTFLGDRFPYQAAAPLAAGLSVLAVGYWVGCRIWIAAITSRLMKAARQQRPDAYVFDTLGAFFVPWNEQPPAGRLLVSASTKSRAGAAVAIDAEGVTVWARLPRPAAVYLLPWEEIGAVVVERLRTMARGSVHGPARTMLSLDLRNAEGPMPEVFCIVPGRLGARAKTRHELEVIMNGMLARRTGTPGEQVFII